MNYYTSNFNHPIPTSAPYHSSHNQIGISNDRDQDSNYDDDDELFKWEFGFRGSKFIVLLLALILRVAIGYFPYSGQGNPPKFGDLEAHRHWMEITFNIPMKNWYDNSENNPSNYWPLDYPPLSGYLGYLMSKIAFKINPKWIELVTSRGLESNELKIFMRLIVLALDLLLFIPAIFLFSKRQGFKPSVILWILACPLLILIDHGHYQMNVAMLGFIVIAITLLLHRNRQTCSLIYLALAISFKQMALFYVPIFMITIFRRKMTNGIESLIGSLIKNLAIVLGILLTICHPFIIKEIKGEEGESKGIGINWNILFRLFPLHRGLFEEKVANFWCSFSLLLPEILGKKSNQELFSICLWTTGAVLFPSLLNLLWVRPNKNTFLYALSYGTMAIFMFAYHVHEKTILIPLIPILLLADQSPLFVFWFVLQSTFSIYPLMAQDKLFVPYAIILSIWILYSYILIKWNLVGRGWKILNTITLLSMGIYHLCDNFVKVPLGYPSDLWSTMHIVQCSISNIIALLYLLVQQYLLGWRKVHSKLS